MLVEETSRISSKVEAGGVTQVTIDETERVYASSNAVHNHLEFRLAGPWKCRFECLGAATVRPKSI